jgi:hypothetical protein
LFVGDLLIWFQKKRLEIKQFFYVTFVVLDTQTKRLLRIVKIIAEPTMVHAVLKLVRKLFIFQVHQCCQRKSSYFEVMRRILSVLGRDKVQCLWNKKIGDEPSDIKGVLNIQFEKPIRDSLMLIYL